MQTKQIIALHNLLVSLRIIVCRFGLYGESLLKGLVQISSIEERTSCVHVWGGGNWQNCCELLCAQKNTLSAFDKRLQIILI